MKNNRKKITKLTERQLVNLVKKVINEQNEQNEDVSALREIRKDFREKIGYQISLIDDQLLDMINYHSSDDEYHKLYLEIATLEDELSELRKRLYDIQPYTDELN